MLETAQSMTQDSELSAAKIMYSFMRGIWQTYVSVRVEMVQNTEVLKGIAAHNILELKHIHECNAN